MAVIMGHLMENGSVSYAVYCSVCQTMLNEHGPVSLGWLSGHDLYLAAGCRLMPHYSRYNPKVSPSTKDWLEVRWLPV